MKRNLTVASVASLLLLSAVANAETFASGSVIIPMDTTYQDMGMLKAYGLVYALLKADVPVNWVIKKGKAKGGADFTASATDYKTSAVVNANAYRGGPWVIRAADAAKAKPVIDAWITANVTTVHVSTASFDGDVARELIVAPNIAMFADGNQKIARGYVQAAGIPDSTGSLLWADTSPDMLDPNEVAGPTTTNKSDGALFDTDGDPVYCQLMSMHWGVNDAKNNPEVVAEVRSFLKHPTHFFAECQAVNAFENDPVNGLFLTPKGFVIGGGVNSYDFYNHSSPFAQLDGAFKSVGGSEPSYSLPAGDKYKAGGITMITKQGTPEGDQDIWMTGYLDGTCTPDQEFCGTLGKISYLGGHEYSTSLPISTNPDTNGTRLFLNSLFEAQCATPAGQPYPYLTKAAPASTSNPTVVYSLTYGNIGPGFALDAELHDAVPTGSTFVSATQGGVLSGNEVVWKLGNLGVNEGGVVSFTVNFGATGNYTNTAQLNYRVGLNKTKLASNTTQTLYGVGPDGGAGSGGAAGADGGTAASGGAAGATSGGGGSAAAAGSGGSAAGGSGGSTTGGSGGSAAAGGNAGDAGPGTGGKDGGASGSKSDSSDSGGCGCRVPMPRDDSSAPLGALLAAGLLLRRRQRGRARRREAGEHDDE